MVVRLNYVIHGGQEVLSTQPVVLTLMTTGYFHMTVVRELTGTLCYKDGSSTGLK